MKKSGPKPVKGPRGPPKFVTGAESSVSTLAQGHADLAKPKIPGGPLESPLAPKIAATDATPHIKPVAATTSSVAGLNLAMPKIVNTGVKQSSTLAGLNLAGPSKPTEQKSVLVLGNTKLFSGPSSSSTNGPNGPKISLPGVTQNSSSTNGQKTPKLSLPDVTKNSSLTNGPKTPKILTPAQIAQKQAKTERRKARKATAAAAQESVNSKIPEAEKLPSTVANKTEALQTEVAITTPTITQSTTVVIVNPDKVIIDSLEKKGGLATAITATRNANKSKKPKKPLSANAQTRKNAHEASKKINATQKTINNAQTKLNDIEKQLANTTKPLTDEEKISLEAQKTTLTASQAEKKVELEALTKTKNNISKLTNTQKLEAGINNGKRVARKKTQNNNNNVIDIEKLGNFNAMKTKVEENIAKKPVVVEEKTPEEEKLETLEKNSEEHTKLFNEIVKKKIKSKPRELTESEKNFDTKNKEIDKLQAKDVTGFWGKISQIWTGKRQRKVNQLLEQDPTGKNLESYRGQLKQMLEEQTIEDGKKADVKHEHKVTYETAVANKIQDTLDAKIAKSGELESKIHSMLAEQGRSIENISSKNEAKGLRKEAKQSLKTEKKQAKQDAKQEQKNAKALASTPEAKEQKQIMKALKIKSVDGTGTGPKVLEEFEGEGELVKPNSSEKETQSNDPNKPVVEETNVKPVGETVTTPVESPTMKEQIAAMTLIPKKPVSNKPSTPTGPIDLGTKEQQNARAAAALTQPLGISSNNRARKQNFSNAKTKLLAKTGNLFTKRAQQISNNAKKIREKNRIEAKTKMNNAEKNIQTKINAGKSNVVEGTKFNSTNSAMLFGGYKNNKTKKIKK
jgi:hypothetical protein